MSNCTGRPRLEMGLWEGTTMGLNVRTQNREIGESSGSEFWGAPTFRKEKEKGANEVCPDAFQ